MFFIYILGRPVLAEAAALVVGQPATIVGAPLTRPVRYIAVAVGKTVEARRRVIELDCRADDERLRFVLQEVRIAEAPMQMILSESDPNDRLGGLTSALAEESARLRVLDFQAKRESCVMRKTGKGRVSGNQSEVLPSIDGR